MRSRVFLKLTGAFLLVNFHPARLFMGDVGSVPIGFLAGTLGVLGWREALIVAVGGEVREGEGSRVVFEINGKRLYPPHPHPGPA